MDDQDDIEYISKTQKKKDAKALQAAGKKLVQLSAEQIEKIDLPPELDQAVKFAKTIKKHGALKRQIQHIGALMRQFDTDPIIDALDRMDQVRYQDVANHKQIESWRDDLIAGNRELLEEILASHADANRQQLTQLIRNAQKEQKSENAGNKSYRALFQYLKTLGSES